VKSWKITSNFIRLLGQNCKNKFQNSH